MVSYLKESFLQPCQMDEDKKYIRFKNYFDLIAQVHSVVETKRGFKYLRVWRAMQLGAAERFVFYERNLAENLKLK